MELIAVTTPALLREYIDLPNRLFKGQPWWVPPLHDDEKTFHDPKKNEALSYSDTARWMVYKDGKPAGRIMAIINKQHNRMHGLQTGRFYNFDCINDPDVSRLLICTAEDWCRQQGMNRMIGPFGFSDKDPQGIKTEGFEYPAVLMTPSGPSYYKGLIEREGYEKEVDTLSYELPIPDTLPATYSAIAARVRKRGRLKLVEFTKRSELKPYIIPVLKLVNETYTPIYGFVPLSETEITKLAAQYLPILNPRLVKVVVNTEGETIGFVVSMPGITRALQRSGGKLFPFGFIHLLKDLNSCQQLVLLLGAVKPGYRGTGATVLLAESLFAAARKRGMTVIDSHVILENNFLMRAEMENLGARVYKRFRVFGKTITP